MVQKYILKEMSLIIRVHIKSTTAWGQILLPKKMGKTIIAETGAGQHGVATATVCALFDSYCNLYGRKRY